MQNTPLRVGIIGFDGANAIDLAGPLEAFASVHEVEKHEVEKKDGLPLRYETVVLGLTKKPFTADSGIVFHPHRTLANAPQLDTLIVPGGSGLRVPRTQAAVAAWLRRHAKQIRRVCSVCTGIYGLGAAGLLDGRRVTTHWRWAKRV